jgi:hypothetical protein
LFQVHYLVSAVFEVAKLTALLLWFVNRIGEILTGFS